MAKRTGPQNLQLRILIKELRKLGSREKVNLWKRISEDLSRPTRIRRKVNLYKINKYSKDGETIIVPGKVLGIGEINKKIIVAAYQFSESAKKKLGKSAISINELMKNNPKGKKVRIIG